VWTKLRLCLIEQIDCLQIIDSWCKGNCTVNMLASLLKLPKYMETTYFTAQCLFNRDVGWQGHPHHRWVLWQFIKKHPHESIPSSTVCFIFFSQTVARYIKDITKWPEDINNFPVVKAIISLNEYSEYTIHLFLTWERKSHILSPSHHVNFFLLPVL